MVVVDDGRLAEQLDIGIEAMVGHVDEAVALADQAQHAPLLELAFVDGGPGQIAQLLASAVGKLHEILVVVIASAGQDGVQLIDVELLHEPLEQVLWHERVIEHADGFAPLAALHSLRYLLHQSVAQVGVHLHLGILGELEGEDLKLLGEAAVQLIDLLQRLLGCLAFPLFVLVAVLHDAIERGHTYAEELVEVIGIDAQEGEPLQQGNGLLLCLLQDALVEVHPGDVALYVIGFNLLMHTHIMFLG